MDTSPYVTVPLPVLPSGPAGHAVADLWRDLVARIDFLMARESARELEYWGSRGAGDGGSASDTDAVRQLRFRVEVLESRIGGLEVELMEVRREASAKDDYLDLMHRLAAAYTALCAERAEPSDSASDDYRSPSDYTDF